MATYLVKHRFKYASDGIGLQVMDCQPGDRLDMDPHSPVTAGLVATGDIALLHDGGEPVPDPAGVMPAADDAQRIPPAPGPFVDDPTPPGEADRLVPRDAPVMPPDTPAVVAEADDAEHEHHDAAHETEEIEELEVDASPAARPAETRHGKRRK